MQRKQDRKGIVNKMLTELIEKKTNGGGVAVNMAKAEYTVIINHRKGRTNKNKKWSS